MCGPDRLGLLLERVFKVGAKLSLLVSEDILYGWVGQCRRQNRLVRFYLGRYVGCRRRSPGTKILRLGVWL